jgi:hypothetical protein
MIELLTIAVAVGIALWKHRDLTRFRKADRELREIQSEQERIKQERRDRQDSWQPEFNEIRQLLVLLEEIESEVRELGPLDRDAIEQTDLGHTQRRIESVARRCPEALRDPLLAAARAVGELRSIALLPDTDVVNDYKALNRTSPASLAAAILPSAIGANAVAQYRAAVALQDAVQAVWSKLRTERGGEL